MKLKKGDKIVVLSGKDKGKNGKVEKVFEKGNEVLVTTVNLYKRHLKRQNEKNPGGIVDIPRPLSISKVALICPKCSLPTRIGLKVQNGQKLRICKKCQKNI